MLKHSLSVRGKQPPAICLMPTQATLQAVSEKFGPPYLVTQQALVNSSGDAQLSSLFQRAPEPGLFWVDVPSFRTALGNRQDRRIQDRIVTWMRAAQRAGKVVVAAGRQGTHWATAALSQLVNTPPWNFSRHRWHKFVDVRATTVLLTTCLIASSLCSCEASCTATAFTALPTAQNRFDANCFVTTQLLNAVCEASEFAPVSQSEPQSHASVPVYLQRPVLPRRPPKPKLNLMVHMLLERSACRLNKCLMIAAKIIMVLAMKSLFC